MNTHRYADLCGINLDSTAYHDADLHGAIRSPSDPIPAGWVAVYWPSGRVRLRRPRADERPGTAIHVTDADTHPRAP